MRSLAGPVARPAGHPAPRRRVKPWMVLIGISIGWKVLVLTLGTAVPRWVVGDGLDRVALGDRARAMQAMVAAMPLWDHPLERLGVVRALRVIHLERDTPIAAAPAGAAAPRPDARRACDAGVAIVRAYTFFAIPYSEARVACGTGVIEYRVFRASP